MGMGMGIEVSLPHILGIATLSLALSSAPLGAAAHPGGLNAQGCHNNRQTGDYHCHRPQSGASKPTPLRDPPKSGPFANCAEARAAGAAPVRRGDPGYGKHLDRDGDGVGCES